MLITICTLPPMESQDGRYIPLKNTFAYRSSCPYNIYLLAAIMEQGGYECVINDWNGKESGIDDIFDELLTFDVIMISSNSWNWQPTRWLIEKLRSVRDDQTLIVGGLQASLFGRKIMEEFPVDYVVRGEGEKSMIPLLRLIEKKGKPEDVPGLVFNDKGEIRFNTLSPLMTPEEMALLPVPLYEKLPDKVYHWLSIESSRGCVNSCIYCSVPHKRSWRPLSAETFVDRLETYMPFLGKVTTDKFLFIDDSFIIDVNRAKDIAGLLKKRDIEVKAIWNSHIIELFEEDMLVEMEPYTEAILVGAESFQEETLHKIGKKFKPEDILKGTATAVKLGMGKKLIFSFIIGFPWQNKEAIIREIDHIYDLVSSNDACALINWLILNPGSRIWNEYYKGKNVSLRDSGKLYDQWKHEVFPVNNEELQEINYYIKCLQDTLHGGAYRLQHYAADNP